jgi:hypothetical protein
MSGDLANCTKDFRDISPTVCSYAPLIFEFAPQHRFVGDTLQELPGHQGVACRANPKKF